MRRFTPVYTFVAALLAVTTVSSPALAQWGNSRSPYGTAPKSGSSYDYQSGNSNKNSDGSTDVRGYNTNNGTMWNQHIDKNGNQRGQDSHGNFWNNDNNSTGSVMDSLSAYLVSEPDLGPTCGLWSQGGCVVRPLTNPARREPGALHS